ncbi:MAG: PIN domain-containing protein [Actinomycetota bacterium]|nr:PIN domain-containing protein [Actinomycetota bacterium]
MKLIVDEPESVALHRELGRWSAWTSSALLGVEAVRACRRLGEQIATSAEASLRDIALVPIDDTVLAIARRLDPSEPRSLDAIHLATALSVGSDLGAFFSYDDRLAAAAAAAGLRVVAPD